MKATIFLPAHPSYFDQEYTQEEIDSAIAEYDRIQDGVISKGWISRAWPENPMRVKYVLLRKPGKAVTAILQVGKKPAIPREAKAEWDKWIDRSREQLMGDLRLKRLLLKKYLRTKRERLKRIGRAGRR